MSKQVPHNRGKGAALRWLRDHVAHEDGACLIWPFTGNWNGYGHVSINGKMLYAHRIMCELAHGAPPAGYVAAHACTNGRNGCVNPLHLAWKTQRDNLLDRRAAGTLTKKRWSNRASLTLEQMNQIIALRGQKNQREIAALFGISHQHVGTIQNRRLRGLEAPYSLQLDDKP